MSNDRDAQRPPLSRQVGEAAFLSGCVGGAFALFDQLLLHATPPAQPLVDLPLQWGAATVVIGASTLAGIALTLIFAALPPRWLGSPARIATVSIAAFWLSVLAMAASRVSFLVGGALLIAAPAAGVVGIVLARALRSVDLRLPRALVALLAVALPAQLVLTLFSLWRAHSTPAWLFAAEIATLAAILGLCLWVAVARGLRARTLSLRSAGALLLPTGLVALAVLPAWLRAYPVAAQVDSPNLILIVLDAMRRDHIGIYGDRANTPEIDDFFSESVVFDHAYASSGWTLPSMVSVFSGRHPRLTLKRYLPILSLEPGVDTLAERLRDRGYATGAFVTNYLLGPSTGALRGFSERLLANHHLRAGQLQAGPPLAAACWNVIGEWLRPGRPFSDTTSIALDHAERFLDRHQEGRFFAWIHLTSPHDPYNPEALPASVDAAGRLRRSYFAPQHEFPSTEDLREGRFIPTEAEKQHVAELYRLEVEELDRQLGSLFGSLERRGLLRNTVVALTADHGEELWDHGAYNHDHSLFAELTAVPLLLRIPGDGGRRIAAVTSMVDLDPTLSALLGLPALVQSDGVNQLDPGAGERAAFSVDHALHLYAMRDARYSAIWNGLRDELQLFDRVRDPGEQRDLSRAQPETAARYLAQLTAFRTELEARASARPGPTEIDPDTLRRLQELGYARGVPSANPPVSADAEQSQID